MKFREKRYGITWYRIRYCCGNDWMLPQIYVKLLFVFKDILYWKCPKCGRVYSIRMVWHTASTSDQKSKNYNKKLEENKKKLYRKC